MFAPTQAQLKFKIQAPVKPRLEKGHFKRIAKASQHFDDYLKETLTLSAADQAREDKMRRDDFRASSS